MPGARKKKPQPGHMAPLSTRWVTGGLIIVALALRLWHIDHGLPDFTEEAFVFRKALELWGPIGIPVDLNPHSFVYPSLTIYLHFLIQQAWFAASHLATPADFLLQVLIDPTGPVVASRVVGVVADGLTLVLVGRMAIRFGAAAAVLGMSFVALAPAMIRTSRLLYSDSIMCVLAMAAMDRLLVYRESGRSRTLLIAAALVGLATGAKYPAALLLVPLGYAVAETESRRRWVLAGGRAAGVALLGFLCTTPYLLASWHEFVRDAVFIGDVTGGGGLGMLEGIGLPYYARELGGNLGWVGAGLLVASFPAIVSGPSAAPLRLLWVAWLVWFAAIAVARVEAERYLVPVVGLGAALSGAGAARLLSRLRGRRHGLIRGGLVAITILPIGWLGLTAAASGRSTTQEQARRWLEHRLGAGELVLTEVNGPKLLTHAAVAQVRAAPLFGAASATTKQAYLAQRAFHMVHLPLVVSGVTTVRLPSRDSPIWSVHPHIVDWNGAAYDVRLLEGIDYIVTSSAVRGRFETDAARFPEQQRFYAFLDQHAERVALFDSGHGIDGPAISIYRPTEETRRRVAEAGPLDSLWWARTVPGRYKQDVLDYLAAVSNADLVPDLPLWAQPLRIAYADRYAAFANDLAENLASIGRLTEAERISAATLFVVPEDVWAAQVYAFVAAELASWGDLERAMARSAAVLARYGPVPPFVPLAHAEALLALGEQRAARALLEELVAGPDPTGAAMAQELLARMTQAGR